MSAAVYIGRATTVLLLCAAVCLLSLREADHDSVKESFDVEYTGKTEAPQSAADHLLEESIKGKPAFCGAPSEVPPLDAAGYKLKHVSAFIRHGDRMRCNYKACWSNDTATYDCSLSKDTSATGELPSTSQQRTFRKKYMSGRNILPGSCVLGQLTPLGYHQQFLNGKHLRRGYSELLPECIQGHEEQVMLRSDDSPRTIASGQALVDGLFANCKPSSTRAQQPIEWLVMEHMHENIFPNYHVCPRLNRAVKDAQSGPAFTSFLAKEHQSLVDKVAFKLGKEPKAMGKEPKAIMKALSHLGDCLLTHHCHGQSVPEEIADHSLLEEIQDDLKRHYDLVAQETKKFAGGPLLRDVLATLQPVVTGESALKFALFSGHDTGPILPLLHALGVADGKWPPYASTILLEVYEAAKAPTSRSARDPLEHEVRLEDALLQEGTPDGAQSSHALRMVYNGRPLAIPGCGGTLCPFDKFVEIARKVIPSADECIESNHTLADKLIHWEGMFAVSDDLDMLGNNVRSSSPYMDY